MIIYSSTYLDLLSAVSNAQIFDLRLLGCNWAKNLIIEIGVMCRPDNKMNNMDAFAIINSILSY